jgi:hypothetical protein
MERLPSASSSCCAVAYGSRVDTVVGYALLAIVAHALIGNRAHMREFRSILRDVRNLGGLDGGAEWIRTDGTASEVGQLKGSFEMFADHYQTIIASTWSQCHGVAA